MCYGDKTWCSQKCGNKNCQSNFTKNEEAKAIKWWGDRSVPVAISDYKTGTCGYIEP